MESNKQLSPLRAQAAPFKTANQLLLDRVAATSVDDTSSSNVLSVAEEIGKQYPVCGRLLRALTDEPLAFDDENQIAAAPSSALNTMTTEYLYDAHILQTAIDWLKAKSSQSKEEARASQYRASLILVQSVFDMMYVQPNFDTKPSRREASATQSTSGRTAELFDNRSIWPDALRASMDQDGSSSDSSDAAENPFPARAVDASHTVKGEIFANTHESHSNGLASAINPPSAALNECPRSGRIDQLIDTTVDEVVQSIMPEIGATLTGRLKEELKRKVNVAFPAAQATPRVRKGPPKRQHPRDPTPPLEWIQNDPIFLPTLSVNNVPATIPAQLNAVPTRLTRPSQLTTIHLPSLDASESNWIHPFPTDPDAPISDNFTLYQVCQNFPNSLIGYGLLPFAKAKWSARGIENCLPQRDNTQPFWSHADDPKTLLTKRLTKLRDALVKDQQRAAFDALPSLREDGRPDGVKRGLPGKLWKE